MEKVRILHCVETIGSGGVEQRRLSLARGLDSSRYEQKIICTKAVGGLSSLFEDIGCQIFQIGELTKVFDIVRYKRALDVVNQFKPHIIHGAVFEGVNIASVVGSIGRVPVVIGEETSDPQNRSWRGNLLYRFFSYFIHHFVAVSPAVEAYLIKKILIPKGKVSMIANGVAQKPKPDEQYVNKLRHELGLTDADFVIGTVGRLLDHHKRVSDLLACLSHVGKSVPNAKLLIVGAGPDERKLRELVNEMQLNDKVIFVGYQSDPQP